MKRAIIFAALLATTSLVTPALAADMRLPTKAPPPAPLPVSDWTGAYFGIEGGYGWGRQDQNLSFPFNAKGQKCVDHEGANPPTDCSSQIPSDDLFNDLNNGPPNPAVTLGNINEHGGLGGVFVGVQKQWGNWVLGFEADYDFADIKGSVSGSNSTFLSFPDECISCDPSISKTNSVHMDAKVSALGSLRGKVGWVLAPDWLVYGTGGVAFANVKDTISQSASVTFNGPTPGSCGVGLTVCSLAVLPSSRVITGTTSSVSTGDTTIVGWAAGAGIDWKYAMGGGSALVFGVEYLHYGFPSQTLTLANNAGPALQFSAKQDVDVVKGRISYFFPIH